MNDKVSKLKCPKCEGEFITSNNEITDWKCLQCGEKFNKPHEVSPVCPDCGGEKVVARVVEDDPDITFISAPCPTCQNPSSPKEQKEAKNESEVDVAVETWLLHWSSGRIPVKDCEKYISDYVKAREQSSYDRGLKVGKEMETERIMEILEKHSDFTFTCDYEKFMYISKNAIKEIINIK